MRPAETIRQFKTRIPKNCSSRQLRREIQALKRGQKRRDKAKAKRQFQKEIDLILQGEV